MAHEGLCLHYQLLSPMHVIVLHDIERHVFVILALPAARAVVNQASKLSWPFGFHR